jgi:hypothetical protein
VPKLPPKGALSAALALVIAACTTAPPPTARPPAAFVISTQLPNGRVEITVATTYALGAVASIPVTIVVTRGSVTGPVTARVMASGIGVPAEVLVRDLAVTPLTVGANGRKSTTITWDTRDAKGVVVPVDAYSLVLEVRSLDGGTARMVAATATLELR